MEDLKTKAFINNVTYLKYSKLMKLKADCFMGRKEFELAKDLYLDVLNYYKSNDEVNLLREQKPLILFNIALCFFNIKDVLKGKQYLTTAGEEYKIVGANKFEFQEKIKEIQLLKAVVDRI